MCARVCDVLYDVASLMWVFVLCAVLVCGCVCFKAIAHMRVCCVRGVLCGVV